VKTAADVYAPSTGEVIGVNEAVLSDPALVNSDAQGKGWIVKVKLASDSDMGKGT